MTDVPLVGRLAIDEVAKGQVCRFWIRLTTTPLGSAVAVPALVARGREEGPVLGVTAALHGNELNGIPVIGRLFRQLDADALRGAVVGVPVLNVPSFLAQERIFTDQVDLNRIMPGRPDGNESEVYAHRLLERVLTPLHYLIDYHTASFGRVNTHYVRADLTDPRAAALARLQNARFIVDTSGESGTLRPVLAGAGTSCITVELCDPHVFQRTPIDTALEGLHNVLVHLGMLEGALQVSPPAEECERSYWMYTDRGGLLEVFPQAGDRVARGERIARLTNVFGDVLCEYTAPEDGVVIGKSVNPVNQTGGRILHLGIPRPGGQ